jgi:thiamine-phosphate pyrophosphorylase
VSEPQKSVTPARINAAQRNVAGNSSVQTNRLAGLYAITDERLIAEDDFEQVIESALQGGTRIIQYRDKSGDHKKRLRQASALHSLCERYHAICIINDDLELASEIDAHGVHLGKDDTSLATARKVLGPHAIIGVSCYNDLALALDAEKNSADYVAFGAFFSSPTKPHAAQADLEIISQAKQQLTIPVCTIGGITGSNIERVIKHGADMAAVISSLFSADDIELQARSLSQHFNH